MRTILFLFTLVTVTTHITATQYYVAKTGDDNNSGAEESPFLTIGAAATVADAGDTCFIGEGTYHETLRPSNSGTSGNSIVFIAVKGEAVIISAMEALSAWTLDEGSIYKTPVDWDLGQKNFVLNGFRACDLARWPNNTDGNPFTPDAYINTGGSIASVTSNAYLDFSDGIPTHNWEDGGSLYFYCTQAGWTSWRAYIKSSSYTRVTFDLPSSWIGSAHPPADLGEFYLQGIKAAIDYDNEWYYDAAADMLYIQIPGGGQPADGAVQMRKREYTIDLSDRQYIEVRNLAVIGGSIELTGSSNYNLIYGVSSFYGNTTIGVVDNFVCNSQSIMVDGSNNTIEKCEVAFGTGTGIWVDGLYNSVINCNIHDFDFIGDYDAPLMVRNGEFSTIRNNTIYRGGRDCVQWFNNDSEFAYNKVYKSNLIADDCGLFYTVGGPSQSEIHHNLFFDTESRGIKYKAAGIYLDNDAEAFDVHHNVVLNTEWSSIQINLDAKDLNIYNNTLWGGSKAMDAWHQTGTSFSNVNVWNNLADNDNWESQADEQNNIAVGTSPFVDIDNMNFQLQAGTDPIDYGREIAGITDGFVGAAPDAGAYEYGGTDWIAGIDWDPMDGPTGIGCYGLPGDPCDTSIVTPVPEAITQARDILLYPNPVEDYLNIQVPESMPQAQLHIYAMNGILIHTQQMQGISETIYTEKFQPGIYFIQIHSENCIENRRFIKSTY